MIIELAFTVIGIMIITGAGLILLNFISPDIPNWYLRVALGFVIGNLIMIFSLSILAGFDLLHLATVVLMVMGALEAGYLLVKFRTERSNLKSTFKPGQIRFFFIFSMALLVGTILFREFLTPLSDWDTRAIWGIKAKSFFLESGFDNTFLTSSHYNDTHRDYPNGLSLMMALFYRMYGSVQEQAVKLYLITFYVNILLLTIGTLKHFFKKTPTYMIILLIIGFLYTNKFIQYSASGYADMPLAVIFASATLCSIAAVTTGSLTKSFPFLLTGVLTAATGVYIKDEGLTFFIVYAAGTISIAACSYGRKEISGFLHKKMRTIISGVALLVLFLFGFIQWELTKRQLNIIDVLPFSLDNRTLQQQLFQLTVIIRSYIAMAANSANWGMLLAPLSLFFTGGTISLLFTKKMRIYAVPGTIILLQLCIYTAAYFFSKHDITWHLQTSLERLFLHLIPSALIVAIFYVSLIAKYLQPLEHREQM
jgi:hypothetical protein